MNSAEAGSWDCNVPDVRCLAQGALVSRKKNTRPITIYLENDGRLEHAQQMARPPVSADIHDRAKDEVTMFR
jgi:hypothetical protein